MEGDAATIRNPLTCGFCGQYNTCDSAMRQGSSKKIIVCMSNCPDAPRDGAVRAGDVGIAVGAIKNPPNVKLACTNLPMQCELCPSNKFVWKYHMGDHITQAHGGGDGVGAGGTPAFRRSFLIPDEERQGVKGDIDTARRAGGGNQSSKKRPSSGGNTRGGSRARTSSGGAGSSSSGQEGTRRSARARTPRGDADHLTGTDLDQAVDDSAGDEGV